MPLPWKPGGIGGPRVASLRHGNHEISQRTARTGWPAPQAWSSHTPSPAHTLAAPQQKPNVVAAVAAVFATAVVLAAPAFAAADASSVKNAVCAANPTAKVCLKGSYTKQ